MLTKHAHTLAMINRDRPVAYLLRDYFGLRRGATLTAALIERGLGQADLVLALLRLRDRHVGLLPLRSTLLFSAYIELLVGHPITIGPRCLLLYRSNNAPPRTVRSLDERRIVSTPPTNPRQPGTGAHARWCEYRVGRTLSQLYIRGIAKRDVRRAIANKWITVEELQA